MAVPKGLKIPINNTPQGTADTEPKWDDDVYGVQSYDVLGNDLGGSSTHLVGLYNGTPDSPGNLLNPDSSYYALGPLHQTIIGAETGATISIDLAQLDGRGALSYDFGAEHHYDHLAFGHNLHDTFHYIGQMASGAYYVAQVDVEIDGENDGPVAVADTDAATEGGSVINGSVAGNDSDVDDGAVLTYAPVDAAPAGLTFNDDGSYSFDPTDAAYDHLPEGITTEVVASYTVTDEWGETDTSTLTITVTGVNDDASITGTSTGDVYGDGVLTAGGDLDAGDVDDGENVFQAPGSLAGLYGTFAFDPDKGVWGYTLNNLNPDVQALDRSETLHDFLTVTSFDNTSEIIDVTIHAVTDVSAPTGVKFVPNAGAGNDLSNLGHFEAIGDTDPDGPYTFTLVSGPSGATVGLTTGVLGLSLGTADSTIVVKATDAAGHVQATGTTFNVWVGADNLFGGDTHTLLLTTGSSGSIGAGAGGNDVITGTDGVDYIYGGLGNDTLIGNGGGDWLSGGLASGRTASNDVYKYAAITDSYAGAGNYDTIADYGPRTSSHGDRFDFSAIDADVADGTQHFGIFATERADPYPGAITWNRVDRDGTANDETIVLAAVRGGETLEIHLTGLLTLFGDNFLI